MPKRCEGVALNQLERVRRRLVRDFNRLRFTRVAERIFEVLPLQTGLAPLTVLSMVQHRDVAAYLVAIRSFAGQINPRRIVVVCDPSLTSEDLSAISSQIPHIEFRRAEEFRHPDIPVGGTWERLAAITEYARDDYVLQLDADTVTLAEIPEVEAHVMARSPFTIGESRQQGLLSFEQARDNSAPWQSASVHVQGLAEYRLMDTLMAQRTYVRGCSGFTGFSPDLGMREKMFQFSKEMRALLGARWDEWGTEQVTSNYLVASEGRAAVLPFPKYTTPDTAEAASAFVHYIGSMRFSTGAYVRAADATVRSLKQRGGH
jgi:hypothetical protein